MGGSGSGKTVSIVEPFLLESFSRSIVCSVTKRGIVNKFIPLLQNRGYKILDLDFVHPSRGNVCFDPLDYINSFADISFLSQSIISGTRRNRNPDLYWDESAASLLNALIAETLMLKDNPTFADVLETIDSLSISSRYDELVTTDLDEKFKFLESKDPLNYASSNWRTFSNLPVKTAGCVFSTLHSIIDSTFTPELRAMFRMRKNSDLSSWPMKRQRFLSHPVPSIPALTVSSACSMPKCLRNCSITQKASRTENCPFPST